MTDNSLDAGLKTRTESRWQKVNFCSKIEEENKLICNQGRNALSLKVQWQSSSSANDPALVTCFLHLKICNWISQRWQQPNDPPHLCHFSGSSRASRRSKISIRQFLPYSPLPFRREYCKFCCICCIFRIKTLSITHVIYRLRIMHIKVIL